MNNMKAKIQEVYRNTSKKYIYIDLNCFYITFHGIELIKLLQFGLTKQADAVLMVPQLCSFSKI